MLLQSFSHSHLPIVSFCLLQPIVVFARSSLPLLQYFFVACCLGHARSLSQWLSVPLLPIFFFLACLFRLPAFFLLSLATTADTTTFFPCLLCFSFPCNLTDFSSPSSHSFLLVGQSLFFPFPSLERAQPVALRHSIL